MRDDHVQGVFFHSPVDQTIGTVLLVVLGSVVAGCLGGTLVFSVLGDWGAAVVLLLFGSFVGAAAHYQWREVRRTHRRYVICRTGLLVCHPKQEPGFVLWEETEGLTVRNVSRCFEVIGRNGEVRFQVPFSAVSDPNGPPATAHLQSLLLAATRERRRLPLPARFRASLWDMRIVFLIPLLLLGLVLALELIAQGLSTEAMWIGFAVLALAFAYQLIFLDRIDVGQDGIVLRSMVRRREVKYALLQSVTIQPYDRWLAVVLTLPRSSLRLPWDRRGLVQLYDSIVTARAAYSRDNDGETG